MAINITQFAPPSRVSSLVWDKNMEPPAGKVFEGDLVGDVTGDVTGDLTGVVRGSLLGYLSRNGVYSATKGALVVPASSSTGNVPTNVNLNIGGGGTYAIVDNTQKCFIEDPCYIPVVLDGLQSWQYSDGNSYAKSFTAEGVLIDSISDTGNLNIYGASYIVLNGGTCREDGGSPTNRTISVADAYIDAGTSLILGDDTPPDAAKVSHLVWDADMVPAAGKKFKGALEGNVTGNVTGNLTGKIVVNGCFWGNSLDESTYLREYGYIPIIPTRQAIATDATPRTVHTIVAYPYFGAFDFQPKPATPALTFTIKLAGTVQSEAIGAQLDVIAADFTTVLRTYSKYNDLGTFTFPVDLTGAYRLYISAKSAIGTTVTANINSLFVRPPYIESIVDV